jgi:CheY-like chemotaxis protein
MTKTILMLEHDDDERYIAQSVFEENNHPVKFEFVTTSHEVFAYLGKCNGQNMRYPSLVILDYLATPSNAIDILRELKSGSYSHIPVVVMSGTVKSDVVRECYAAGASSFIQKPADTREAQMKVSSFVKYWFETVALP